MITVLVGDAVTKLKELPNESVHCVVTSPPYWGARDYDVEGQIGLEKTPEEYVFHLVEVFREVRRVLRSDGTLWLNLADCYASEPFELWGVKPKDEVDVSSRTVQAMQKDGWYRRRTIIWVKPNAMPESVRDRPTKNHEYVFLLTKSATYFFDQEAVRERFNYPERTYNPDTSNHKTRKLAGQGNRSTAGLHDGRTQYGDPKVGRNIRSVWEIPTQPYPEAHFAVFPEELPRRCIKAGCPKDGTVLDPFAGSGTTGAVARSLGRKAILIELNPEYAKLIDSRSEASVPDIMVFGQTGKVV